MTATSQISENTLYKTRVGMPPNAFAFLVAVLSFERVVSANGVTRRQVAAVVGKPAVYATPLIKRGLLRTEGDTDEHQRLFATELAWREFWELEIEERRTA